MRGKEKGGGGGEKSITSKLDPGAGQRWASFGRRDLESIRVRSMKRNDAKCNDSRHSRERREIIARGAGSRNGTGKSYGDFSSGFEKYAKLTDRSWSINR